jgi:hypothetical protein
MRGRRKRDLRVTIDDQTTSVDLDGANYRADHRLMAVLEELKRLRRESSSEEYGRLLFDSTFQGDAKVGYELARERVADGCLRVWLYIFDTAPNLHALWWECLTDPASPPEPLGGSSSTTLARGLVYERTPRRPVEIDHLRILVVVASPAGLGHDQWKHYRQLDVPAEQEAIRNGTQDSSVELEFYDGSFTPPAIGNRLRQGQHNVLHLVAHGFLEQGELPDKSALLLEAKDQRPRWASTREFSVALSDLPQLRLVVLAACQSGATAEANAFLGFGRHLIRNPGVPAVVAMQDKLTYEMSQFFAEHFYRHLCGDSDGEIQVAVNQARAALRRGSSYVDNAEAALGAWEWYWPTPVLFIRGNGRILKRNPPPRRVVDASVTGGRAARSPLARDADLLSLALAPGPRGFRGEAIDLLWRLSDLNLRGLARMFSLDDERTRPATPDLRYSLMQHCDSNGELEKLVQLARVLSAPAAPGELLSA